MEELCKNVDKNTIDNLDWSVEYLWASVDLLILTKVLARVNRGASGPENLEAPIIVIHDSNFEIMDKMKDNLAATKLSGFLGYNVELYCDHQQDLL